VRLLVSVADAAEARDALAGGADIIDAKDPTRGALGAVPEGSLRAIVDAVRGARPVSAALGDAADAEEIERSARSAAAHGLAYVKVGFAGIADPRRAEALLAAAVRGVRTVSERSGVVAVAYADAPRAGAAPPDAIVEAAARGGAIGVLLDTAFKDGGGVFDLMDEAAVRAWAAAARAAALTVGVAGQLRASDLATARALGADLVGVRGAACEEGGGRTGRIDPERVAALARATRATAPRPTPRRQYA
jgi:uncharacterized protein (UPF0264 family)